DYAFGPDPERMATLAGTADALTFTLGGISKLLGLPQMKLAWICVSGPVEQVSDALARLEVVSDTYLSVNTPVQHALPRWRSLRREITGHILRRVLANRQYLLDQVRQANVCQCLEAEGGWYAILRLPAGRAEEEFVIELLEHEGVLTHPGYFYDFEEGDHLVLSLLPPPPVFQEGMNRLLGKM
ncbi:MAG: aminotransferase class I/II-fold pyridoxal phosphate-dependent enzyme, partial [candidate division WOR-3 bacterium]